MLELKKMELNEDIWPEEVCTIDDSFTVYKELYQILKLTISHNLQRDEKEIPFNLDTFAEMIVRLNIERLEDNAFMTTGPDNTIYLCGRWLYRPVFYKGKKISTLKYFRQVLSDCKIVYLPHISGAKFRKKLWISKGEKTTSFILPRNLIVDNFRDQNLRNQIFSTRRRTFRHMFISSFKRSFK